MLALFHFRQTAHDLDTILIVQTQFKVMVDDGQLEPDGLQPLSIRLAFRVDLHLIDQNLHQSAAFRLGHGGIELIEANQDLIDVVACDFVGFNGLLLCPGIHQPIFNLFDFIVHLIKAVVKVGFPGDKVAVIRVKAVDLLHKPGFCGVVLPQLLLIGGDFLNKVDVAATMRILRELTPTTTQQGRAVRKSMDKQLRGKTRRKR